MTVEDDGYVDLLRFEPEGFCAAGAAEDLGDVRLVVFVVLDDDSDEPPVVFVAHGASLLVRLAARCSLAMGSFG